MLTVTVARPGGNFFPTSLLIPQSTTTGMSAAEISEQDIVIAFMGPPGTGKSFFIDLLTGEEGKRARGDLVSVTQDVDASYVIHPQTGKRVVLVDTPAFDHTNMTELQVLKLLADWLEKTYRQNIKLCGIVYLHCIMERYMHGSALKNLNMFKCLCGDAAMSRVVLTTTMWKDVEPELGEDRQKQLDKKFWPDMISHGASVDRLKFATHDEAWRVVDGLIGKHTTTSGDAIQLQSELVDLKRSLNQTEAGKAAYASHMEFLRRVEGRRKEILQERKQSRDVSTLKILDAELAELGGKIKKARQEIAELKERRSFLGNIQAMLFAQESVRNPTLHDLVTLTTKHVLNYLITEAPNIEAKLDRTDVQVLANYLDLVLDDDAFAAADQQNRVLTLLSRIAVSTHIYPQRYILKPIEHDIYSVAGGASADVYQALRGTVCVKVMKPKDLNNEALTTYVKELILWSRLSHPNVLPFFGIFISPASQRMCLVSPWMKNGNLSSYTANISQQDRMPLLSDVADGLAYLHQLGIVHSDIKGENVLVSEEGRALITDFGVSHIATDTMKQGITQSTVGHFIHFAAPEVLQKMFESARVRPSKACDIWSFGCLCYEVLTRRIPFFGLTLFQIYRIVCTEQGQPTRPGANEADWEEVNDDMWELMFACWAFDLQKRPDYREIHDMVSRLVTSDNRPPAKPMAKSRGIRVAKRSSVDLSRVEEVLREIRKGTRA